MFWVWGPLMVLGTQYAIAETLSLGGLTLSVLLGLGPPPSFSESTSIVRSDREKAVRTLPVRLGEGASWGVLAALTVFQLPVLILACWRATRVANPAGPAHRLLAPPMQCAPPESRPKGSRAQCPLALYYGFDHTRRFAPAVAGLLSTVV